MKPLTLVAAVTLLAGCTTWRVQWINPETVIRRDQPGAVEVTLVDSSRVVVREPEIVADSLVGDVDGTMRSIALREVAYVAVRRDDASGNVRLVLLATLAASVAILATVASAFP